MMRPTSSVFVENRYIIIMHGIPTPIKTKGEARGVQYSSLCDPYAYTELVRIDSLSHHRDALAAWLWHIKFRTHGASTHDGASHTSIGFHKLITCNRL
jgi:hypothetical protein